ncbi:cathepsin L-like proteinase [Euwallacea fornicatus]|uniref:cathepsin L-like proteinase n=1 Tax=Euwallacea fornicatus TaxID=995702 RepID=UPI0033901A83
MNSAYHLLVLLFVSTVNSVITQFHEHLPHDQRIDFGQEAAQYWIKFKKDYLKQYSPEESLHRFDIFKNNLIRINDFRQKFENGLIDFQVGITEFSDMTKEEFINKHLTIKLPQSNRFKRDLPASNRTTRQVPEFFDWRSHGAVTAVKHQGACASCWAFSAVGALETQYFLKHGKLLSFSEQNLVDCSVDTVNNGCNGGWMANAFQYLKNHDISSLIDYPYIGIQQGCHYQTINSVKISLTGFQTIPADELSLLHSVATIGTISAAIDASNLQFYAGGVFRDDECLPGRVNHGVVVVGYGIENGREYWLIKNSWGTSWGENGYFKLIRNRANQCNIASYMMYPILN